MNNEDNPLVLAKPEFAVKSMRSFQDLKEQLLDKEADVQVISGKSYIKRSGWRKIALGFNISTAVLSVEREQRTIDVETKGKRTEQVAYVVRVKARATAPNGRFSEEIGACQTEELLKQRMEPTIHNLETKATTRAINRAISNLVGGGQVSADELDGPGTSEEATPQVTAAAAGPEDPEQGPPAGSRLVEWSVKGEPHPLAVEGPDGRFYGFLRKTLDSFRKGKPDLITETMAGKFLVGLSLSKDFPDEKVKELTQPLMWALQKSSNATKEEIAIKIAGVDVRE